MTIHPNLDAVIHLSTHPDGPGWYFFDETWADTFGPYADETKARHALAQYSTDLNRKLLSDPLNLQFVSGDLIDFWDEQFEEAKVGEVITPIPDDHQSTVAWNQEYTPVSYKKLDLETAEDFLDLDGLIDGGYLSFIYGSRKRDFGGWANVKVKYNRFLMILDSGGVRQNEYPLYKSRRNERRDQYDYMRETYEQVQKFREILKNDPMVNTARIDGYEADDIIALLFLKGFGTKRIIAQDKDFFMVPGMREAMTDHTGIPQIHRDLKLPKYAIPPNKPATWALTQAIFGDKSDSIPRLLPSRIGYKEIYNQCIKQAPSLLSAFWNCMAEFGDQFETNLRLVLLPHPTLAVEDYDITSLLFEDLCSGKYWDPDNYNDHILDEILYSIKDMTW